MKYKYRNYAKVKFHAYRSWSKALRSIRSQPEPIHNSLAFSKLALIEQYALALALLDTRLGFCGWFAKGRLAEVTIHKLREFLEGIKLDTQCVDTLRLIYEIQNTIVDAYHLLCVWESCGDKIDDLDDDKQQEITALWAAYSLASENDRFQEIVDRWFEKQIPAQL